MRHSASMSQSKTIAKYGGNLNITLLEDAF